MKMLKSTLMLAAAVAACAAPACASFVTAKVPEPATFGLLASGIAGIALLRKMRK